jgi:hypothetical protein
MMARSKNALFRITALFAIVAMLAGTPASATSADASGEWQRDATGLKTETDAGHSTGGLGFNVQAGKWPRLSARGGVNGIEQWPLGKFLVGPAGVDLGEITLPGVTASSFSESADWARNEMTFASAGEQLKVWVTRLSPAIALRASTKSLALFGGPVKGNTWSKGQISARPASPSYPKYVAFRSGGAWRVEVLGASPLALPALEGNAALVWYGTNSHFVDAKVPLDYQSLPWEHAYQADAPLLLVFENKPASIKHATGGGIELAFGGPAGYLSVLPLSGRETLKATETEAWAGGLPAATAAKAGWWSQHLCQFPAGVSESYAYNRATREAQITETFQYLPVCAGGKSFAPIPPFLALARAALDVRFSGPVVDAGLATEFGPTIGIEGVSSYTWTTGRAAKYVDAERVVQSGVAPAELEGRLAGEVRKLAQAGHMAPWVFMDAIPRLSERGDVYWLNPADTLYPLIEAAGVVNGTTRAELLGYLRSERAAYPPEDVFDLPLKGASPRKGYAYDGKNWANWEWVWTHYRKDVHLRAVPLYNFYVLSRYYDLTQEALPAGLRGKAQAALDREMRERDWATLGWFKGFEDRKTAATNANRHLAGLIGYVRLAEMAGDRAASDLGQALLAKAAALRVASATYPRYLYATGLVELPAKPDWQPASLGSQRAGQRGALQGELPNYSWSGPYDDARQVATLDEFGVFLREHTGYGGWNEGDCSAHVNAYENLVPEVARLLRDTVPADARVYAAKYAEALPAWFATYHEAVLGQEHNLAHPADSYQIFMAKALLEETSPALLVSYVDIPWLQVGDLFYVHKLAETLKQYRGLTWQDRAASSPGGAAKLLNGAP